MMKYESEIIGVLCRVTTVLNVSLFLVKLPVCIVSDNNSTVTEQLF